MCSDGRFASGQLMLVGAGCNAETHPGLWEYLARQADDGGNATLAHVARQRLWDANWRSYDVALKEAAHFLQEGDSDSAAFVIEDVCGRDPQDIEARLVLARCHLMVAKRRAEGGPVRTDAEFAKRLAGTTRPQRLDDLLILIDLLRFSGEFDRALARIDAERDRFPDDPRLDMRAASIQDQRGAADEAIALWLGVAGRFASYRKAALLRVIQTLSRLDRCEEAVEHAAALLGEDLDVAERIRLGMLMGQGDVVEILAEYAAAGGDPAAPLDRAQSVEIGDMLLEGGYIGLVHWLRRQRAGISERAKSVLDACGFDAQGNLPLPRNFAASARIRSPDFLVPVADFLNLPPKPAGWPGEGRLPAKLLMVNFSLAAGGAERQFVELIRALSSGPLPPGAIEVACYTLAHDRGHDRFLPELEDLGLRVHDLTRRKIANTTVPPEAERLIAALPAPVQGDTRALWHLANEIRPDVLHGWQDKSALAAGLVGHLLGIKRVVLSMRNMSPDTRRDADLARMRALYADYAATGQFSLTANARAGAEDYARWIGCAPARIALLQNAVDETRFTPALRQPASDHALRIGGIFRLAPNKRPGLWLHTVATLAGRLDRPVAP
ncbi:hypothetical protein RGUI_3094 [Rhodovulum sp. P5]|nr:hypothetical protein RGUI_3094 [Rhodovulum sp. P5]